MVGNHVADLVARYGDTGDAVPRALTDYIKAREGYDYSHHGKAGNPSTAFVPDDIVDRFCLLGPPERHVDRLARRRESGATNASTSRTPDARDAPRDASPPGVMGALCRARPRRGTGGWRLPPRPGERRPGAPPAGV